MGDWWRSLAALLALTFRAARRQALTYYVVAVAGEIAALASVWGFKDLLDAAARADAAAAARAAAVIAGLGYLVTVVNRSQFKRAATVIEKTTRQLDEELMTMTSGIAGIAHHENPDHADRIALLVDGRRVAVYVGHTVAQVVRGGVQLGGSVLLLAGMHPALALLPLFAAASLLGQTRAQRHLDRARLATAADARHQLELVELATSAAAGKEVRLFGLHDELLRRHGEVAHAVARERNRAGFRAALLRAGGRLGFAAGYAGATAIVLREAVAGRATPGDVILAVTLAAAMNARLAMAADEMGFLGQAAGVGRHLLWLRDRALAAARSVPSPSPVPTTMTAGIEFDHVSFSYPGATEPALHEVSFAVPAGSVVALVGENGSGKTTLVKLLLRMYEPTGGRIAVDGSDLATLDPDEWRSASSAAFQDFCRFELLLGETVGVGDVDSIDDPQAVRAALERSGADEVADGLPDGVATQLGRTWGGVDLSGGQWQKLALGRGLMRPVPLLVVFDEPTASLDPVSEHVLFERFAAAARHPARRGSVTLLVSHRFSSVRMADRIVVLSKGRVLEVGSHEELVRRGGLYAELYALQARALTG